jgi:hypothetical protein
MTRRSAALTLMLVLVVSLMPSLLVSETFAAGEPTAEIHFRGTTFAARQGQVVGSGTSTIDADSGRTVCHGLDHEILASLPANVVHGQITLRATQDCVLRVSGVEFTSKPRTAKRVGPLDGFGFAAQAAVEHRIWSRHAMREYVDIWTTWVYQEFTYQEDLTLGAVWGVTPYQWYCAHDGVGWNFVECYPNTTQDGDQLVERYTFGRFHNNCCGGIDHTLKARPYAGPGWSWRSCTHTGALPAGWELTCEFGQTY